MGWLFAVQSGWRDLAERFPATSRPSGKRVWWQVLRLGRVPDNGSTHMVPSPDGLYLYAGWIYRSFRRPILIPWSQISSPSEVRELWWKRIEVMVPGVTTIRMSRRGYRVIKPFVASASEPPNKPRERARTNAGVDVASARAGRPRGPSAGLRRGSYRGSRPRRRALPSSRRS